MVFKRKARTQKAAPIPKSSGEGVSSVEKASFCRDIISINSTLPKDQAKYWLTADEIHDRLVYCGVRRSLQVSHVDAALRRMGMRAGLVDRHPYNGIAYFRPSLYSDIEDVPNDQRWKK